MYQQDVQTLAEVGAVLRAADLALITVRLPQALADRAVGAWERVDQTDGSDPTDDGTETTEERVARLRAGTLALIGAAVADRGRAEGDTVVVDLDPELVGVAMDTADDLS